MMKAHIHLECIRTISLCNCQTVRTGKKESKIAITDSSDQKEHPEGKQRKDKAHEKWETTSGWSEDLQQENMPKHAPFPDWLNIHCICILPDWSWIQAPFAWDRTSQAPGSPQILGTKDTPRKPLKCSRTTPTGLVCSECYCVSA